MLELQFTQVCDVLVCVCAQTKRCVPASTKLCSILCPYSSRHWLNTPRAAPPLRTVTPPPEARAGRQLPGASGASTPAGTSSPYLLQPAWKNRRHISAGQIRNVVIQTSSIKVNVFSKVFRIFSSNTRIF